VLVRLRDSWREDVGKLYVLRALRDSLLLLLLPIQQDLVLPTASIGVRDQRDSGCLYGSCVHNPY
jgi:hypothetical protein